MTLSHLRRIPAVFSLLIGFVAANAAPVMVSVGDAGNDSDSTGYGAVSYAYNIGKYEVTNTEYAQFLNAVAATDSYALYNTNMATNTWGGITRSGASGSYSYAVKSGFEQKAVNYVSLFDAARYVNWLSTGNTETGVYSSLGGATSGNMTLFARNSAAWNAGGFAIASENEWYKAAYYKGGSLNAGYWTYATQSNSAPIPSVAPNDLANQANYYYGPAWTGAADMLTPVGSFTGSASAYGTFDQNGSLHERMDTSRDASNQYAIIRGGAFPTDSYSLSSAVRDFYLALPDNQNSNLGFRVSALAVPEPSTYGLIGAGAMGVGVWARRRRRSMPCS